MSPSVVVPNDPNYDPEKNEFGDNYALSETTPVYIRHAFIRKVLTIVFFQLLFTVAASLTIIFVPPVLPWLIANIWLMYVTLLVYIIFTFVLFFFPLILRKAPWNILILIFETAFISLLVGFTCALSNPRSVIIAVSVTTVLVAALIAFSFQTKYDFTQYLVYLVMASLVLFLFGFIFMFVRIPFTNLLYSALGALLAGCWIVIDIQMIVGGKSYQYTVDDFVLASISLYIDIIRLFLHLLSLFSRE